MLALLLITYLKRSVVSPYIIVIARVVLFVEVRVWNRPPLF